MVTVKTQAEIIFQVLVTRTTGEGYQPLNEHWFGCDGASEALDEADQLVILHQGSYDWNDYDTVWVEGAETGRSRTSVTIPADVTYTANASGPDDVFEGTVTLDGVDVTLRLVLTLDEDELQTMTWYHKGTANIGYLVRNEATVELEKKQGVGWGAGWHEFSWAQ